jgi:VanZ family protein
MVGFSNLAGVGAGPWETAMSEPQSKAGPTRGRRLNTRLRTALPWITGAYTVLLVCATHSPRPQEILGSGPGVPSDKTMHVVAYFLLSGLAAATLVARGHWTVARVAWLAVGLVLFAAIDEVTQPFFSRFADRVDWVADCAGIALGIGAVAAVVTALKRRARAGGERT